MHLDGEPVVGINEFDQQREFSLESFIDLLSYQFIHVDFQDLVEFISFQKAIGHNGLTI